MTDVEQAWLIEVGMRLRLARVKRRLSQREAAAAAVPVGSNVGQRRAG